MVADQIRGLILSGDLVPNQRLVEGDLAEQLDASRSAVRQALGELTVEGLVERVPHRGARVRVISFDEAIEIAEVRMALESLCARKAAERITDADASELTAIGAAMQAAVAAGDLVEYSARNRALHRRIHGLSGQRTALRMIERVRAQSVRQQFALAMKPGRPSVSVIEHLAIIEAIVERDADAAALAMSRHLESVMRAMHEVHERSGS